jgi:hypothetical protein
MMNPSPEPKLLTAQAHPRTLAMRPRPAILKNAPPLKIDKLIYRLWGRPPPHVIRERRIVWALLEKLYAAGYEVCCVEGDPLPVITPCGALELIFNLDEALVYFRHQEYPDEWVRIIRGNGCNIVSGHSVRELYPFGRILEEFDGEDYA